MRHILRSASIAALAATLAGCTTWVDVQNVTSHPKARGIRYSLPSTYLLVQPQADGTATYTWVYLPDLDKTYAISQHAILSKFTLDVTLANGLLGKVNSQGDSTALPAKLLDAAQTAYAAKETKAAADKKGVTTAKTAVTAAKLALAQAQQESDAINAAGSGFSDDQKRAAMLKLIDAKAALAQAQQTLTALPGGGDAADLPAGMTQWGPVLFHVAQDADGTVKLVAVNDQQSFATVTAATAAAPPGAYTLNPPSPNPVPSAIPLTFSIGISVAISDVDAATTIVQHGDGSTVTDRPTLALSADKKSITVTFVNGLPRGKYILTPGVIATAGRPAVATNQVSFDVQ